MSKNLLAKETARIKKMMGFDYKDNSHEVLSEQNIRKAILKEQETTVTTVGVEDDPGGLSGEGGVGIVRTKPSQKASKEDISNYGKESLGPDIKKAVDSGKEKINLPLSEANQISVALVNLALTNKDVRRTFRVGIGNRTLTVKKIPAPNITMKVLNKTVGIGRLVKGKTTGTEGTDETPKNIILYKENVEDKAEFATIAEMSEYITSENIKLFSQKKPTEQWYLHTWNANSKGIPVASASNSNPGNLIISKGPIYEFNGVPVLNMVAPSTRGGGKEGSTEEGVPKEHRVQLKVNLTETFETGSSTFKGSDEDIITAIRNQIDAQLEQQGFTNIDIDKVSILSSASNHWGGYVAPSHTIGGKEYSPGEKDLADKTIPTTNNNYTSAPSGTEPKDKNNKLAWDRGQSFATLLNSIEGEESFSINAPNYGVRWRVSDTKGANDVTGCKIGQCGQFATIILDGTARILEATPDIKTPGTKISYSAQYGLILSAQKTAGGITLFSWFGARKAKYLTPGGKFKNNPKTGRPFSGLPKWLDSIIYK